MKHGKVGLYVVTLMSIGAGFILLPKVGASSVGRYLSRWAILGSGNIYGMNNNGLVLIAWFLLTIIVSFMIMREFENRADDFVRETRLRS